MRMKKLYLLIMCIICSGTVAYAGVGSWIRGKYEQVKSKLKPSEIKKNIVKESNEGISTGAVVKKAVQKQESDIKIPDISERRVISSKKQLYELNPSLVKSDQILGDVNLMKQVDYFVQNKEKVNNVLIEIAEQRQKLQEILRNQKSINDLDPRIEQIRTAIDQLENGYRVLEKYENDMKYFEKLRSDLLKGKEQKKLNVKLRQPKYEGAAPYGRMPSPTKNPRPSILNRNQSNVAR